MKYRFFLLMSISAVVLESKYDVIKCKKYNLYKKQAKINTRVLPFPYNSLKKILPFDNHGWYVNAAWIENLFLHNDVHNAIEIGSWLGASTRHIASLLKDRYKIYAIDTWFGSVENHDLDKGAEKLPLLWEQFLSNIIHANLTHRVIPIRSSSIEVGQKFKELFFSKDINFIYLDAAHDYDAVMADLETWYPYIIQKKGILCGDDWAWSMPQFSNSIPYSVRAAVVDFAKKYNLTVCADANFWFIREDGKFEIRSFLSSSADVWKVL